MKLVITGRPEIGKTTLVHIMDFSFREQIVTGMDAIDLLKETSFPEAQSNYGQKCRQRAIYHLQVELENLTLEQAAGKMMVCDHGTLDALAHWPDTAETFLKDVHSTLAQELARYDWVLQINGPPRRMSNVLSQPPPLDPQNFWCLHPQFLSIPVNDSFSNSYTDAFKIIQKILSGQTYEQIQRELESEMRISSTEVSQTRQWQSTTL